MTPPNGFDNRRRGPLLAACILLSLAALVFALLLSGD